jgi:hypothetical protein
VLELANDLLSSDFMPHGHCYLWTPLLVWLEVASNAAIGVAYLSISLTLAHLVRTIRALPFQWVYVAFGVFIITCGFTHFMDVWVIWRPNYWLDVAVRIVTAVASVGTAVLLFPLLPRVRALAATAHLAHQRGLDLERLNAELATLYENARETLAEAIPQLVWTATPEGRVEYLNQRWVDYTGERSLGTSWAQFLHPDDAPRALGAWTESVAGGEPYEMEYRLRRKDGAYRWFLGRALPLRERGRVVKWFGTCTDVHEQRLLVERRDQLLARAEEDLRARDVFLMVAAHELRTPLTPLRLEVEGLLRAAQGARIARLTLERLAARLAVIEQHVGRLERLVDGLLDVARVTTEGLELRREELDLTALVTEVVDGRRAELERAGGALTLHLAPSVVGRFDRLRVVQIVESLLGNTITHARGAPVTVTLAADPEAATLTVGDEGPGIALEDQARIFERFERATSARHGGGFGLGLWLVRRLAEAHGGAATVESAPSRGARFTVRLPRV